ncbi:protein of unknown function [Candidatus Nitrospira inopinata]|uniref:Uncharacterized protein n=1 Tax=Candidatus Nitrospira inopinata TaxID=1715989 RepID=A0A0S4KX19_9BACT|nr:protein of unknown function [Candidatus Nitrospira inopinata]
MALLLLRRMGPTSISRLTDNLYDWDSEPASPQIRNGYEWRSPGFCHLTGVPSSTRRRPYGFGSD